jgi:hypothetical protein
VVATYTGKVNHLIKLKYLSLRFAKILTKYFKFFYLFILLPGVWSEHSARKQQQQQHSHQQDQLRGGQS